MPDFNHKNPTDVINFLIDNAIVDHESLKPPRQYIGGSRLGVACKRALQFEYFKTPGDDGPWFSGQVYRIFQVGHVLEDMAVGWLRMAGFDLRNQRKDGSQFGFSTAGGRIQGHVDGVIVNGPDYIKNMGYPCLWECKTMNDRAWKDCKKRRVRTSKPVYAGQIAVYQAYMALDEHPALFTAINKNTQELYHELVEFDANLAQNLSDKGVDILKACDEGRLLPRMTKDPDHFECKWCNWRNLCWSINNA